MKMRGFALALILALLWAAPGLAQTWPEVPDSWGYVSLGMVYGIENIDPPPNWQDVETPNVTGASLLVGYVINPFVAVEGGVVYMPDWESEGTYIPGSIRNRSGIERDITMYLLRTKISPGFKNPYVKPYAVGTIGWAHGRNRRHGTEFAFTEEQWPTDNQADFMSQAGAGCEFFPSFRVSFYLEGSYMWGWNDFSDLKYFGIASGFSFRW